MSPRAARSWFPVRTRQRRRGVGLVVGVLTVVLCGTSAVAPAAAAPSVPAPAAAPTAAATPLQQWLAQKVVRIAHRGGSADWPEGSPLAYRRSEAWSPQLALEFPARRTADGVWVASEDATTGRVFGTDLTIATSTWAQLQPLRSIDGRQQMSRLEQTVLAQVPRSRIVFVDDKDDAYVDELLDLVDRYGGAGRAVMKSYWANKNTPPIARARGYQTWGYYYPDQMAQFSSTQGKFTMLAMSYSASAAVYRQLLATGKRVFAHIVADDPQADAGLAAGATGLMVSGVRAVVPRAS